MRDAEKIVDILYEYSGTKLNKRELERLLRSKGYSVKFSKYIASKVGRSMAQPIKKSAISRLVDFFLI